MTKTSIDLANEALHKLGLVGLSQAPEAEDTQRVLDLYEPFKESISAEEIYDIPDDDDIDLRAFNWLAEYLAGFCKFNIPATEAEAKMVMAEKHLRRIKATKPPDFDVQRSEYF